MFRFSFDMIVQSPPFLKYKQSIVRRFGGWNVKALSHGAIGRIKFDYNATGFRGVSIRFRKRMGFHEFFIGGHQLHLIFFRKTNGLAEHQQRKEGKQETK